MQLPFSAGFNENILIWKTNPFGVQVFIFDELDLFNNFWATQELISFRFFSRKLFNLTKEDDVRQYVIKRPLPVKEGKKPKSVVSLKTCVNHDE